MHNKLRFKDRNASDNVKVTGMNEIIILKRMINKIWQRVDWIHLPHEGYGLRGHMNVDVKLQFL